MEPTPLEMIESVDMLRVLEHGYQVKMILSPTEDTYAVDTPAELSIVEKKMRTDTLIQQYLDTQE